VTVLHDPEVLDVLHNRPELLAVADAVHATQRRRRTGKPWIASAAAVAAGAAAVTLLAPWHGAGAPVVAQALAAIGNRPVIHLIVRTPPASPRSIHERQTEIWYDERHRLLHVVVRSGAHVVVDVLETPHQTIVSAGVRPRLGAPLLAPALRDFTTRYRSDLRSGRLRLLRHAPAPGRHVVWLRSGRLLVAVDRRTFVPVFLLRTPGGRIEQVVLAESLPLGRGNFRAPRRARHP
jgi:hypothetical protein